MSIVEIRKDKPAYVVIAAIKPLNAPMSSTTLLVTNQPCLPELTLTNYKFATTNIFRLKHYYYHIITKLFHFNISTRLQNVDPDNVLHLFSYNTVSGISLGSHNTCLRLGRDCHLGLILKKSTVT